MLQHKGGSLAAYRQLEQENRVLFPGERLCLFERLRRLVLQNPAGHLLVLPEVEAHAAVDVPLDCPRH